MYDGLDYGSAESSVVVTTASAQLVGPNPDRIALLVSLPVVNSITLSIRNPAVYGAGIRLQPGSLFAYFCSKYHGDYVTKAFFGITAVGSETIGLVEVISPGISKLGPQRQAANYMPTDIAQGINNPWTAPGTAGKIVR